MPAKLTVESCLHALDNLCKSDPNFYPYCPMKTGRPPRWNPVAALGRDVWTDVVPLASKGRVVLPVIVRDRMPWLADTGAGVLALAETGRRAELLPWASKGEAALAALRLAIEAADEKDRDQLALAAMDRFVRLSMEDVGRTILPPALASLLEAEATGCVRIVMCDGRLWLWSERRWEADRARRIALLMRRDAAG